jgi:hypothetical protein
MPQQQMPEGTAMDLPATAEGFRRRRLRRLLAVGGSWVVVAAVVIGSAVVPEEPDDYIGLQVTPLLVLLLIAPVQIVALACGRRERRILESYGWQAYDSEIRYRRTRVELLLRLGPGDIAVLTPRIRNQRPWRKSADAGGKHDGQVWFCGDPRYGGVVSYAGGGRPVRFVRDKRPKKLARMPEPFPGADELAVRSSVLGTAY